MPRVARHANANAKAPDCGSKSGDAGRSLRAADGVLLCAARRRETNSFRPFALFWRPGFAALQTRDSYASLGRKRRQGRERERGSLAGLDESRIFVGCDSITPAASGSGSHVCRDCIALSSFTARGMRGDRTAEARPEAQSEALVSEPSHVRRCCLLAIGPSRRLGHRCVVDRCSLSLLAFCLVWLFKRQPPHLILLHSSRLHLCLRRTRAFGISKRGKDTKKEAKEESRQQKTKTSTISSSSPSQS